MKMRRIEILSPLAQSRAFSSSSSPARMGVEGLSIENEDSVITAKLQDMNLVEKIENGDGDCMYHVISSCMLRTRSSPDQYPEVGNAFEMRQLTAKALVALRQKNPSVFADFKYKKDESNKIKMDSAFNNHVCGVKDDQWGSETELLCLSQCCNVAIVVISALRDLEIYNKVNTISVEKEEHHPVWFLTWHENERGNRLRHYNSAHPAKGSSDALTQFTNAL
jgi:hypothetical protein